MIFKTGWFYLYSLFVVKGLSTDNAEINCTTICYRKTNGTDQYCYVECVTEKSNSSSHIIDPKKPYKFKGYSGYAAVAARIRFYKQQRENSLQEASKQHQAMALSNIEALLYFLLTVVLLGYVGILAWFYVFEVPDTNPLRQFN